jgi:phosphate transport system permease protein
VNELYFFAAVWEVSVKIDFHTFVPSLCGRMEVFMSRKFLQSGLPKAVIYLLSAISIAIIIFIFIFVFYRAWPVIKASGLSLITTGGFDSQIQNAFYASAAEPMLNFGFLGLIYGTLMTTLIALIIATVIGLGAAVTICEYTTPKAAAVFIAIVRLLASVPSVVFGLVGIITVVPLLQSIFTDKFELFAAWNYAGWDGRNMLAAIIVLTFMIVPTVVTLSVNAIRAVPDAFKETGYAFGMKKFRVINKIILPSARSGIIAGVVLAAGRGIGEAIAVSMVCGGLGILPTASMGFVNFLAPTLPLASAIINKSEAMGAVSVDSALFACGAMLLIIGAILSIAARAVNKSMRRAAGFDD